MALFNTTATDSGQPNASAAIDPIEPADRFSHDRVTHPTSQPLLARKLTRAQQRAHQKVGTERRRGPSSRAASIENENCEGADQRGSVRLSSRSLGWHGLNFEQHEAAPSCKSLPSGSGKHLVILSLARGRLARRSGGESVERELHPGAVAVYPAGVPMCWRWSTPLSYSVLTLDPAFLNQVAAGIYGAAPGDFELIATERDHDSSIATLAGVLTQETIRAERSRLYVASVANILAVHLLRHYVKWESHVNALLDEDGLQTQSVANAPESVQRAIRYIHAHHTENIDLNDIAGATNLSAFHLARLFKQALGSPPHQYLIRLRVQSAVALLRAGAGKRSLADVALASGFSDQSHLTRHVKRVLGVTPGQLVAG
jgi:AraC family transcriptional regulator